MEKIILYIYMSNFLEESEINKQTRDFEVLSSSIFPETIILLVTTHGEIILNKEGELPKFVVPNDMTIIRSLSSVVGECNIVNPDMVNDYSKIIKKKMKYLSSNKINDKITGVERVTQDIRNIDISELPNIVSDIKTLNENSSEDDLNIYKGYNYNIDKAHTITIIGPGKEIINKKYTRTDNEATKYDWIIKAMNLPGEPELLKYLTRPNRVGGESTITLNEIVNFLKSKGVKTIIIFDISCSNIRDSEMSEISEREARRFRKQTTEYDPNKRSKMKFGGKRKKKTKKNKKRRKRTLKKHKYSRN